MHSWGETFVPRHQRAGDFCLLQHVLCADDTWYFQAEEEVSGCRYLKRRGVVRNQWFDMNWLHFSLRSEKSVCSLSQRQQGLEAWCWCYHLQTLARRNKICSSGDLASLLLQLENHWHIKLSVMVHKIYQVLRSDLWTLSFQENKDWNGGKKG